MERKFRWGRNTVALVPGLTLMFANLWVPAEIPHLLLGGLMEATGAFTVLIFYLKDNDFKRMPIAILYRKAIVFFTLFFVCLTSYIIIYYTQNIQSSKYDTSILLPFWKSNELQYMIEKSHNASNAISEYGPEQIRKSINDVPFANSITILCFMTIYILIFEFLVLAFSFITVNAAKQKTFKTKNI